MLFRDYLENSMVFFWRNLSTKQSDLRYLCGAAYRERSIIITMKAKRIAVFFCAAVLLTTAGCTSTETDTVAFDDAGQDAFVNAEDGVNIANAQETDSSQKNGNTNQANADSNQPSQAQESMKEDTEWEGVVESIGNNSIVASKIAVEDDKVAVYAYDSDEKVTVYFSAETIYEIQTVKNGGVNGDADVEKQQGAFSDIREQSSVTLTGSYQGDDFYAEHVVIYQFV